MSSCSEQYAKEVTTFNAVVIVSIMLTVINLIFRRITWKKATKDSKFARGLSHYHWFMGTIKIALAITIFCIFPSCPIECQCSGKPVFHVSVALFPLIVGILWIWHGFFLRRLANAIDQILQRAQEEEAVTEAAEESVDDKSIELHAETGIV